MSEVARIVPSRRPAPVRIVGFAVLLVGVSWGLGTFAAWPWTATPPGEAAVRISLTHVSAFAGAGVQRSAEELAKLPAHMRPKDASLPATGRRTDATLTVVIDGREVLLQTYRPTGFHHDGPVYAWEQLSVAPGRHTVTVTLRDAAGVSAARESTLTRELELRPGHAPLFEYSTGSGWRMESAP